MSADAAVAPTPAAVPARGLTIGLVCAVTLVGFESLAIATALPVVVRDLGGLSLYGWVPAAFMLANLVGVSLAGARADREGPGRVFGLGLACFATGLAVGGLAPTMLVVVGARVVQGFGAGNITAAVFVGVARGFDGPRRARMLALISSAWVAPGLFGPAIAGWVAQHVSWRLVFLGLIPLALLPVATALPALIRLGPPDDPDATAAPVGAALGLAAGAGLVLAALSQRSAGLGAALAAVGIVLVGLALRRGLVPADALRARGAVGSGIALRLFQAWALFTVDLFLPLAVTDLKGASPTLAGATLTASALSWTAGAWVQARRSSRGGSSTGIVPVGLALIAVGIAIVATLILPGTPIWVAAIGWTVGGLGMGLSYSGTTLTVLAASAASAQGRASSALALAETLGIALGTGLAGATLDAARRAQWTPGHGYATVFLSGAAAALVAVGLSRRLVRTGLP